jgi:hypothetical protein
LADILIDLSGAGPFELLKNARQMAGVVAATGGSNIDEKLSSQHRRQGSVKTAIEVSKRLGIRGLYSGFHLHACELFFSPRMFRLD